jgi:hypothetical protein
MSATVSDDDVLEKMLMEAQRLALRMRSSTHSATDASHGSYLSDTDHLDQTGDANIVSCDSNHSQPGQASKMSLSSYFDKISKQESLESRETNLSCEEKSYASVASAQQDAIAEAIKATQEMEKTLRALSESPPNRPKKDIISLHRDVDMNLSRELPVNALARESTPKNPRNEDELNTSSSHISWEKVDPIREEDEDFVPIVDYTSPKKKAFPRDDSEIKWEKITSPDKDEDDYVPIADYTSRSVNQSTMQRLRGAILPNQTSRGAGTVNGLSRRSLRKKRRKVLKAMAVLLAASAAGYWLFFQSKPSSTANVETTIAEDNVVSVPTIYGDIHVGVDVEVDLPDEPEKEEDSKQELPTDQKLDFEELMISVPDADRCSYEVEIEDASHDVAPVSPSDDEDEKRPIVDPAEEEIICLFGGRCSKHVKKRTLFTRDNIELLLASMMQ